nr:hypothetical protein RNT25_04386 [arsenite-oxidising bacterium NT-25]
MMDVEAQGEQPLVYFNQLDQTASFVFRGYFYQLPGRYFNLGEARKAAEQQCRAIGWKG